MHALVHRDLDAHKCHSGDCRQLGVGPTQPGTKPSIERHIMSHAQVQGLNSITTPVLCTARSQYSMYLYALDDSSTQVCVLAERALIALEKEDD